MARKDNLKKGNKQHQFTSKNQPSKEAKKQGWRKKLVLKDIASQIVQGQAIDDLKPLAIYLGIEESEIDVETLMHLSQMSKAIKEQDTRAYNAVMDRLKGKPKQEVDHTTNGESFNKPLLEIDPLKDD
jgi:hypothetical protein